MKNRYYYEAMSMADFIPEGHNVLETATEYRVCTTTVKSRIRILSSINPKKYKEVMLKIHEKDGYEDVIIT